MKHCMAPKAQDRLVYKSHLSSESVPITVDSVHSTPRSTKVSIVRQEPEVPTPAPPPPPPPSAPIPQVTSVRKAPQRIVMPPSRSYEVVASDSKSVVVGATTRRAGVDLFGCCVTVLCCLLLIALCVLTAAVWRLTMSV